MAVLPTHVANRYWYRLVASLRATKDRQKAAKDRGKGVVRDNLAVVANASTLEFTNTALTGLFLQLFKDPLVRGCTAVLLMSIFWQMFVLGFYLDDWGFIVATVRAGGAAWPTRTHAPVTPT